MKIKQIIKILIIIQSTLNECGFGCLKCDEVNKKCLFCDVTNNYIFDEDSCIKAQFPNCLEYSVVGFCSKCKPEFYIENGECVGIPSENKIENCEVYQDQTNCYNCEKDYYVTSGKCQKVESVMEGCEIYKSGDWSTCLECGEGYILTRDFKSCMKNPSIKNCHSFNSVKCSKCLSGYIYNQNYYLSHTLEIINETQKEFLKDWLTENKLFKVPQCQQIITQNCKEFEYHNKCKVCQDNYFLGDDFQCYSFPEDSITNCVRYEHGKTCLECEQGFYIKSATKCEPITAIDKCIEFNPSSTDSICTRCSSEYKLSNAPNVEPCILRTKVIANCEIQHAADEKCLKCSEGFGLTNDTLKCLSLIDKCSDYEFSNEFTSAFTCKFCDTGLSYSTDQESCIAGVKENCDIFSNNSVCYQCKNKFYIPGDDCLPHLDIKDCIKYDRVSAHTCTECTNTTFLFNRVNQCIETLQISNCDEFIKINKCFKCSNGFKLVDNADKTVTENRCELIDIELNCLQEEDGVCLICRSNYVINGTKCVLSLDKKQEFCGNHNANGQTTIANFFCSYCKEFGYPRNMKSTFVCTNQKNLDPNFNVTNCTKYFYDTLSLTFKCSLCKDTYYLDNDACNQECVDSSDYIFLQKLKKIRAEPTDTYNTYTLENSNVCGSLTNGPSNCKKIVPNTFYQNVSYVTNDYICVQCLTNYFYTIELKQTTNFNPVNLLDIEGRLVSNPGLKCVSLTKDIIISDNKIDNLVQNCDYYYDMRTSSSQEVFYGCLKCKFGYTGVIVKHTEPNYLGFINSCHLINDLNNSDTSDAQEGKCDTDIFYQGYTNLQEELEWNKIPLESLISCHKCQVLNGEQYRPFLFVDFVDDTTSSGFSQTANEMTKHISINPYLIKEGQLQSGSGGRIQRCLKPLGETFKLSNTAFNIFGESLDARPEDCAHYLVNTYYTTSAESFSDDPDVTTATIYCIACVPDKKPSYLPKLTETTVKKYLPYYIYDCTDIPDCQAGGTWVNNCEKCDTGFVWEWDDVAKTIKYNSCVVTSDFNCMAALANGECQICDKGYEFFENASTAGVNVKICERTIPSFCNDSDTVFVNDYQANPASPFFGRNLLALRRYPKGCNFCREGYIGLEEIEDIYICVKSSYLVNGQVVDNDQFFIPNCKNYTYIQDSKELFCKLCVDNYVPTTTGGCISNVGIENCDLAVLVNEIYNCEQCSTGFIFLNNKCVKGSIDKCKEYNFTKNSNSEVCQTCEDGFYSVSSACLTGKIQFCKEYNSDGSCKTCIESYQLLVLKDNVSLCVEVPIELQCRVLNEEDFQSKTINCVDCKSGYFPANAIQFPASFCLPISQVDNCYLYNFENAINQSTFKCKQCDINYYLNLENLSCQKRTKIDEHCSKLHISEDKCITCKAGYYLAENNLDCSINPTGVAGCRTYTNSSTCQNCRANKYFDNEKCLDVPEANKIPNCLYYHSIESCIECESTHFISNNVCAETTALNCLVAKNNTACLTCPSNFGFKIDKYQVDCEEYTDVNCENTMNEFPFQCVQCRQDYYPKNGVCTKRQLQDIENCLAYSSETTCQKCKKEFVLSIDHSSCDQSIFYDPFMDVNCDETILVTPPICVSCQKGFYFFNQTCTACETQNVEAGCFYCNPRSVKECLLCATGFYHNADGQCVKQTSQSVNNTDDQVDDSSYDCLRSVFVVFVFLGIF